jgi:ABC-2 type transport system ATP-binding protein
VIIINRGQIVAEDTPSGLQARLTGADHVLIKIRGEIADALPVFSTIPGVIGAKAIDESEAEISMAAGQDVRPEIARQVIKNGFDLLHMKSSNLSLEDIFMQLTQDEPTRPSLDGTVEA